jgi:hypothetical protein
MWTVSHRGSSTATPAQLFAVLSDVERWHEWNAGVAGVELHGPFATGTQAIMIMPDGEKLPFRLARVDPAWGFADETPLPEADVVVHVEHLLEPDPAGGTTITYRCVISGPGADTTGPEIGPMVTGDFPAVIAALATRAEQR